MPFTKEREERLNELFDLIEQNGDIVVHELTYLAVPYLKETEEIVEAQWKDLGMPETLWHCHVKEFGPLIVSIDSYGKNYFEEKKVEYNKKKDEQIEIISKQVGFIK